MSQLHDILPLATRLLVVGDSMRMRNVASRVVWLGQFPAPPQCFKTAPYGVSHTRRIGTA